MITATRITARIRRLSARITQPGRPSAITVVVGVGIVAGATAATAAVSFTAGAPRVPAPAYPTTVTTMAPEIEEVEPPDIAAVGDTRAVAPQGKGRERVDAIPLAALAAYQRTEAVINTADPHCHATWVLVAAAGRVLTDHGERGDRHRIAAGGRVTPALIGPTLRSKDGRPIPDSDGGRLDDDRRHDHAVGPMLIDPPTWGVVGVDADGDGRRDPQDVDDAALAAAVRLCAGNEDLRRAADRTVALRELSRAPGFVAAVLDVAAGYRTDLRTAPPIAVAPVALEDLPDLPPLVPMPGAGTRGAQGGDTNTPNGIDLRHRGGDPSEPGGVPSPSDPPSETPTEPPTDPPTEIPTDPPTDPPTETPTDPPTDPPTETPTDPPTSADPSMDPGPTDTTSGDPSATP
jgi:hypothetical protein